MTLALDFSQTALDRGLARLRRGWTSGWQLLNATGRVNANGAARDARKAALRMGLRWFVLEVNQAENGPGSHHRLWLVLEPGQPIPIHRAMMAGAKVREDGSAC